MQQISLDAVPNQSLSVVLNNVRYDLTIKETRGVMVADIVRNDVPVVTGARIVAGQLIIPSLYQEDGNFCIDSEIGAIPYWTEFGVTQFLFFFTAAELEAERG